jgi:putative Holliday junction resolvase
VMPAGTVLGFDYGVKRIGVAVGETVLGIASPLGAIREESNAARFARIGALVSEWKPAGFVVGRPRHSDGTVHTTAQLAERFARRLRARHALPVVFVDETLTSAAAEQALRAVRTRARRPGDVDAMAATIILQSFFDDPDAHERLAS